MTQTTTTTRKTDGATRCAGRVREALERLIETERPRYRRLWAYYRNPLRVCGTSGGAGGSERPYRQAQEWGLPARITGVRSGSEPFADGGRVAVERKEVVIENDIAWRVGTMVDYLFGKSLVISSSAKDPRRREVIGRVLRAVVAANGGIQFLQEMATLGAVYGFVDVLVKLVGSGQSAVGSEECGASGETCGTRALGEAPAPAAAAAKSPSDAEVASGAREGAGSGDGEPYAEGGAAPAVSAEDENGRIAGGADDADNALVERVARMIRLEIVEPARALPLLSPVDYRVVEGYGQVIGEKDEGGRMKDEGGWWGRVRALMTPEGRASLREVGKRGQVVELITADWWGRFEGEKLMAQGANSLGEVPLVHVQNTAAAFEYSGQSDVEPLIPLQDELNTRLSDRAHRITMQSFKMYLGKGIDAFVDQPVSPGRLWMTENEKASIQEFGGDAHNPSEESHISDLREALDKTSGVTPVAAGAIKNRIGRLTSAAALRITLLALLSKTDKKRTLYGAGIERMCALALKWLDVAGVFATAEDERGVELSWPSPLPENTIEKLQEAEVKVRLGVERGVVLRELGY